MSDDDSNGTGHLYPRVLLKISGESLMGKKAYGIDPEMVAAVAQQVVASDEQRRQLLNAADGEQQRLARVEQVAEQH